MDTAFYVLLVFVIIFGLLGIFYILTYNKIQKLKIRIDEAEVIIDEEIRKRFDLMNRLTSIMKESYKIENKYFKDFESLKSKKISNFDLDRKITEGINLFKQLIFDYSDMKKDRQIKEIEYELKEREEKLEAAKAFYNTYTTKLNEVIRSFPSNIVAKFHKITIKAYFDGKDLNDDDINDFKL